MYALRAAHRGAALALAGCIAVLCSSPSQGQVYPYFGPANGVLFGSTSSGVTRATTASDLATLVSCSANQIIFTNSTPAFACSSNLTWADSTGTLTLGNGGNAIFFNPANNTDQKNTLFSANVGSSGSFGFQTLSDLLVGGDTLIFNRNGNTLTGFLWTFSGATAGTMTLQLSSSTDLKLSASNQPHYQVNDPTSTHNTGVDLENSGSVVQSWACFGSGYAGNSPLAGGPTGPQCFMGDATNNLPQPLLLGTAKNEMLRLDSFNGSFLAKIPQSTVYHSAGIGFLSASNTTGSAAAVTIGDATHTGSTLQLASHVAYAGAATPTVSACGSTPSGSVDAHASDSSGTITVGGGAVASCTLTFGTAYTTSDHCRVTSQSSTAAFAYSYTLSAITITATSFAGDLVDYACDGF